MCYRKSIEIDISARAPTDELKLTFTQAKTQRETLTHIKKDQVQNQTDSQSFLPMSLHFRTFLLYLCHFLCTCTIFLEFLVGKRGNNNYFAFIMKILFQTFQTETQTGFQ